MGCSCAGVKNKDEENLYFKILNIYELKTQLFNQDEKKTERYFMVKIDNRNVVGN